MALESGVGEGFLLVVFFEVLFFEVLFLEVLFEAAFFEDVFFVDFFEVVFSATFFLATFFFTVFLATFFFVTFLEAVVFRFAGAFLEVFFFVVFFAEVRGDFFEVLLRAAFFFTVFFFVTFFFAKRHPSRCSGSRVRTPLFGHKNRRISAGSQSPPKNTRTGGLRVAITCLLASYGGGFDLFIELAELPESLITTVHEFFGAQFLKLVELLDNPILQEF